MKPFDEALEEFRREYVIKVMRYTGGNVTEAARVAGWSRQYMTKQVAKYRLQKPQRRGNWGDLTN